MSYIIWKSLFAATPKLVIGLEVDIRRLKKMPKQKKL